MAFYDRIVERFKEATAGLVTGVRRRLGLVRILTIYSYTVRVSGVIEPPKESTRRKKRRTKETMLTFELSFEFTPHFRTITPDYREALTRYTDILDDLVSEQELISMRRTSIYGKALSTETVEKDTLDAFLRGANPLQKKRYKTHEQMLVPIGKPVFMIADSDFEPVSSVEVPEGQLREFTATDSYVFKIRRPDGSTIDTWQGDFTHDL